LSLFMIVSGRLGRSSPRHRTARTPAPQKVGRKP
jgi:hypothetical protein